MAMGTTTRNIMITTPTKSVLPSWWIVPSALVLLALGGVMLTGRLMLVGTDAVQTALLDGRPVTPRDQYTFEGDRLRVAGWFPGASVANGLAMSFLDRAVNTKAAQDRKLLLQEAAYWQKRALSTDPADTYGWLRLAYLYQSAEDGGPRGAQALGLSLVMAPYEPRLLVAQAQVLVRAERVADPALRARLPALLRAAFRVDGEGLARAAMTDHFVGLVEDALSQDASDLAQFREIIGSLGGSK